MFWDKFESLCKENNVKPNTIAKDIGVTSGTITAWKKGTIPNGEALHNIAEYFGTTIDFLFSDDEIYIKPSGKKSAFMTMLSLPQRWASLRHGKIQTTDEIIRIAEFVDCSVPYLYSDKHYEPSGSRKPGSVFDDNTLDMILGIMDRCPDTSDLKRLQEQLSHIVLYWTDKHFGEEQSLLNSHVYNEVSKAKLKYLYTGATSLDPAFEYGLNFTEIDVIREKAEISFRYLFTGIKESPAEIIAAEKDKQIAELEARIAELEKR
ncbi:MAG: helix-turn-helix domain-containing protein [Oscillospiraceae bacterium]|nr:helix-turn-helix domain-containing protein [Oscillospiraceae bacterium]